MTADVAISLDRADELLAQLRNECTHCITIGSVTPRAEQLTHEVCERVRSTLDRLARLYWKTRIEPNLQQTAVREPKIYFPICRDLHDFDSTLGRWQWAPVRQDHQPIYDYLLALQPFTKKDNEWWATVNELAVHGKHIQLIPQELQEEWVNFHNESGPPVRGALRRFVVAGTDINALSCCTMACEESRRIAKEMISRFGLP